MDFATLDTKTSAEKGARLHLRHPAIQHLLYTGDGCDIDGQWINKKKKGEAVGVVVRGTESKSVQDRLKILQKQKVKGEDEIGEESALEFVCSLVIGFFGLERDGKPIEANDDNKRLFFEMSDGLVEQVVDFSKERANFFTATSSD